MAQSQCGLALSLSFFLSFSLSLSICLSLSIYLPTCLPTCISVCLWLFVCLWLSVCLSVSNGTEMDKTEMDKKEGEGKRTARGDEPLVEIQSQWSFLLAKKPHKNVSFQHCQDKQSLPWQKLFFILDFPPVSKWDKWNANLRPQMQWDWSIQFKPGNQRQQEGADFNLQSCEQRDRRGPSSVVILKALRVWHMRECEFWVQCVCDICQNVSVWVPSVFKQHSDTLSSWSNIPSNGCRVLSYFSVQAPESCDKVCSQISWLRGSDMQQTVSAPNVICNVNSNPT